MSKLGKAVSAKASQSHAASMEAGAVPGRHSEDRRCSQQCSSFPLSPHGAGRAEPSSESSSAFQVQTPSPLLGDWLLPSATSHCRQDTVH